jgi:hypothetical protein
MKKIGSYIPSKEDTLLTLVYILILLIVAGYLSVKGISGSQTKGNLRRLNDVTQRSISESFSTHKTNETSAGPKGTASPGQ